LKTLAASERDFHQESKSNFRVIEDHGVVSSAALGADGEDIVPGSRRVLRFRWSRADLREENFEGVETLTVEMGEATAGQVLDIPGDRVRAVYSMRSLPRGEGSFATQLKGTIRIDALTPSEARVTLDLDAEMARTDLEPDASRFREQVRGSYRLPVLGPGAGIAGLDGSRSRSR
jgi:hypothetical protein